MAKDKEKKTKKADEEVKETKEKKEEKKAEPSNEEKLQAQLDEKNDQLLRMAAEYDNFRKRSQRGHKLCGLSQGR